MVRETRRSDYFPREDGLNDSFMNGLINAILYKDDTAFRDGGGADVWIGGVRISMGFGMAGDGWIKNNANGDYVNLTELNSQRVAHALKIRWNQIERENAAKRHSFNNIVLNEK
jgi:hypothetical protein